MQSPGAAGKLPIVCVCLCIVFESKAFDTTNHDLLLAKLKVYGFSKNPLELMCSYLKNLKQFKLNHSVGERERVHWKRMG